MSHAGAEVILADTQENAAAFDKLSEGKKRLVLIDIKEVKSISREARQYYGSEKMTESASATALLVGSPVTRVIGSFFLGLYRPSHPVKLFTSEAEAIKWLKGFVK